VTAVEAFIARWENREGGQERANYGLFLPELCDVLGVPRPDPADATTENNDYVLERAVREPGRDGSATVKRIDLYKRDCFILEAKQSRLSGDKKVDLGPVTPALPGFEQSQTRGRRGVGRAWDVLMLNARRQAEDYVRLLPANHTPPPFVLVCDVGHCIEIYANFRRDGKAYDQFPDRRSFRVYLEDLRDEGVRERLRKIWLTPMALDPALHAAAVTRDIATRLAGVTKALEKDGHPPEQVALFLMRVLFTMFAEDTGLLPKDCFKKLLRDCEAQPEIFPAMLTDLWQAMDVGGFTATIKTKVRQFNGQFFKDRRALPLGREEIGELRRAAEHDWRDVEPAIFGTLLEQALDTQERRSLGAHYTPRRYVERLVIATIIDPLRADWAGVMAVAERQKSEGRAEEAIKTVRGFHQRLCDLRVLDPACGTGNFLYVALELMKRLEGEVLEALVDLGGQEGLVGLQGASVDPHQFLGLELNPRAAAIAELVLWIGHLQWHIRTKGEQPSEPILKAFKNIRQMDAVLSWEGQPLPRIVEGQEVLPNPKRPDWPTAEFIIGNPPFIGGKDLRLRLGNAYAEALWAAHPKMNESADFVMYWWDHAAEILARPRTPLRRFGFVTTNSISQVFQRRVMERYLAAKKPISLIYAIPDHPWTKATDKAAAVRIAMTVAAPGKHEGRLLEVIAETAIDTDTPVIECSEQTGRINADLTVGTDLTAAVPLMANEGLCSRGMSLHGSGFIVTPGEAAALGLGRRAGLENHIRPYRNGRDLAAHPREVMVIDLFGLTAPEVRQKFPEVYQHLLTTVKPERDANNRATYRDNWWIFGEPRRELRPALQGLNRYIVTIETAKHRVFQFLDAAVLPDNMLVAIASSDAYVCGLLSSRCHVLWALAQGATLEDRPRYSKSRCFDPFPFPDVTNAQRAEIAALAEELDAHRKRVLAEDPALTLTGLYNVLERLRAGTEPKALTPDERMICDRGQVVIIQELHAHLDAAVAAAYGWPVDLAEAELLARLVALNQARAKEEKRGRVRWLRPDYQIPRFGSEKEQQMAADLTGEAPGSAQTLRDSLPKDEVKQTACVMHVLGTQAEPLSLDALAAHFKAGKTLRPTLRAVLESLKRLGVIVQDPQERYTLYRA
jgi:hypothetical protein